MSSDFRDRIFSLYSSYLLRTHPYPSVLNFRSKWYFAVRQLRPTGVTAWEVLNIGDVIRCDKLTEEGTTEHPTSRRYELKAQDGATLKVIIDFDGKHDKNKSVINFYSDRKPDTGAHNVSSGIITDLNNNIPPNLENANPEGKSDYSDRSDKSDGNGARFMTVPQEETLQFKKAFKKSKVFDAKGVPLGVYHGTKKSCDQREQKYSAFFERG